MLSNLICCLSIIPALCSLAYLKAPRITEHIPETKTEMYVGFYKMKKPVIIDSTYRSLLYVDGDSKVEVDCDAMTLLPTVRRPRIYYNRYEVTCIDSAIVLPEPIIHNWLSSGQRLSSTGLEKYKNSDLPLYLEYARISYAHLEQVQDTGLITLESGQQYQANLDKPVSGYYTDITIKNGQITDYQLVKPKVSKDYCELDNNIKRIPYDMYDLRDCIDNQPN